MNIKILIKYLLCASLFIVLAIALNASLHLSAEYEENLNEYEMTSSSIATLREYMSVRCGGCDRDFIAKFIMRDSLLREKYSQVVVYYLSYLYLSLIDDESRYSFFISIIADKYFFGNQINDFNVKDLITTLEGHP